MYIKQYSHFTKHKSRGVAQELKGRDLPDVAISRSLQWSRYLPIISLQNNTTQLFITFSNIHLQMYNTLIH